MRPGVVALWALAVTIVLVAVGIFGSLIASGRVTLFPTPTPTVEPVPEVAPVVDTSFSVVVLNATDEQGLAMRTKDEIVAAGWSPDSVLASQASVTDFPETTVYYAFPADEAAAKGLAEVIGGARVEQSDRYLPLDDPGTTEVDESQATQLTVVLGLDRTAAGAPAPEPSS